MQLLWRLWHSPTFTTWGSYAIRSSRFLLVTPLILTRLSQNEIAAWYLFASLGFLGDLLIGRTSITFQRMISLAMGGATDLSPVTSRAQVRGNGKPNWQSLERAYGTLATLQTLLGVLCGIIALGFGIVMLPNITRDSGANSQIWWAFAVVIVTTTIGYIGNRYTTTLYGMNQIALVNRWNILFDLLSILAGSVSLFLFPGILTLAIVTQSFVVIGVIRLRWLARSVEHGKLRSFHGAHFDRGVFSWCWDPLWRGLVGQFSDTGVVQLAGIIFAKSADVATLASYLLTVGMVQTACHIASAPFMSVQPIFSRLLAQGSIGAMRDFYYKRVTISLSTLAVCLLLLLVAGNPILAWIGSHTRLLNFYALLLICVLVMHTWFQNYNATLSAQGNRIVLVGASVAASFFSIAALLILPAYMGVYGVILAAWAPRVLIYNWQPVTLAAHLLGEPAHAVFTKNYRGVVVFSIGVVLYLLIRCTI